MKNFHRLGTIAAIAFGVALALLLWAAFSGSPDAHEQSNARIGLRVLLVAGAAFWGWYLREEQQRANPARLSDDVPFAVHLEVLATFDDNAAVAAAWLAPGRTAQAVLALGEQGFDARLRRREPIVDGDGADGLRVVVQLLMPTSALASLMPGSTPRVFIDGGPTGTAQVLPPSRPAA